jgi:hypothetical protein
LRIAHKTQLQLNFHVPSARRQACTYPRSPYPAEYILPSFGRPARPDRQRHRPHRLGHISCILRCMLRSWRS